REGTSAGRRRHAGGRPPGRRGRRPCRRPGRGAAGRARRALGPRHDRRARAVPGGAPAGCRLRGPRDRARRARLARPRAAPAAAFQQAARRWGVSAGSRVVVYDSVGGTSAARAWWLLRYFGVDDVHLLDGGLAAWTAQGLALEPGEVTPDPGDVVVRPGGMPVLDADEAAALADGAGVLLDARAGERYRGEVEPVDPQAGHVPGAVSAPTTDNLRPDGRFLSTADLRRRFADLGVPAGDGPAVGVYCGSGVTASHEVAALAVAGVSAALYPGSWSQWSNDPSREVATGA